MQELTTFISGHPTLSVAAVIILILLVIVELMRAKRSGFRITPTQAIQMINHDNAVVVDLRPNEMYRKGHIIDSISLTAQEIKATPKKIERFKTKPMIIVCDTGMESQKMAAQLLKQGYNAYSLAGGLRAWSAADMPLVKE